MAPKDHSPKKTKASPSTTAVSRPRWKMKALGLAVVVGAVIVVVFNGEYPSPSAMLTISDLRILRISVTSDSTTIFTDVY